MEIFSSQSLTTELSINFRDTSKSRHASLPSLTYLYIDRVLSIPLSLA